MNQQIYILDQKVGGNEVIDASASFSTDAQELSRSYEYSFTFTKSGTDGNPIVKVEGSHDGVNWVNPYVKGEDCDIEITKELTANPDTLFDAIFPYKYIRISGEPNGTTTGTLSIKLALTIDA